MMILFILVDDESIGKTISGGLRFEIVTYLFYMFNAHFNRVARNCPRGASQKKILRRRGSIFGLLFSMFPVSVAIWAVMNICGQTFGQKQCPVL